MLIEQCINYERCNVNMFSPNFANFAFFAANLSSTSRPALSQHFLD